MTNKNKAKEFFAKLFIDEFINGSLHTFDRGRRSRFHMFENSKDYSFSEDQLDHVKLIVEECVHSALSGFFFNMGDKYDEFERIQILIDGMDISGDDDLQSNLYGKSSWLEKYLNKESFAKSLLDEPSMNIDKDKISKKIKTCPGSVKEVRATWDGDTTGWMLFIDLVYLSGREESKINLCVLRGEGGDMRVLNGTVPPWPEAKLAKELGQYIKDKYSYNFVLESDAPT